MVVDEATVEARLRRLELTIADMDRRLRAVEGSRTAGEPRAVDETPPEASGLAVGPGVDLTGALALIGRTFMVFGGAFLLRALTDAGQLLPTAGVALGLLYAVAWLIAAEFGVSRGHRVSAVFHGVTAVAIGLPLTVEATTRFGLLSPWASATTLATFSGVALLVAWRRDLHVLAGFATLATLAVVVLLAGRTGAFVPYSTVLVALGIATLWLGYDRDWFWMRWVTALVANVAMLGLTTRAVGAQHAEPAGPVVAVQLTLVGLYLGSFAARTLWRGRVLVPFEVAQTVAALAVGLGGALTVARASGSGLTSLGAGSLAFGAGAYAVAFAFVGKRQGLGANFYFYSTLALLLTLTGTAVLLTASPLWFATALAVLALSSTWVAHRTSQRALEYHGAAYCVAAAVASGLLATDVMLLAGKAAGLWPAMTLATWVAFAGAAACASIWPSTGGQPSGFSTSAPRLVFVSLTVLGASGVALLAIGPSAAGAPPDAGALATLRTALLAVAAVGLAACTRFSWLADCRWLVFPVLGLTVLKLLLEDIRFSRPATLFVALALLGAALVLAPRLIRRTGPAGMAQNG